MTMVFNMSTGIEVFYLLPPVEALYCAVQQFERKNGNTFSYNFDKFKPANGNHSWGAGDWAVLK